MANRGYTDRTYRYGFNGQEKDDELNGEGNALAFRFRIHDPRIGRFLSVDPLGPEYPWYSPYHFAGNKTIWTNDLEGLEDHYTNGGILVSGPYSSQYKRQEGLVNNYISVPPSPPSGENFLGEVTYGDPPDNGKIVAAPKITWWQIWEATSKLRASVGGSAGAAALVNSIIDDGNIVIQKLNPFDSDTRRLNGRPVSNEEAQESLASIETIFIFSFGSPKAPRAGSAKTAAREWAHYINKRYLSRPGGVSLVDDMLTKTTAVFDTRTGKYYYGTSGKPHPANIHPELKKLFPGKSLEPWAVENCAEVKAVNDALWDGATWKDMEMHTVKTRQGTSFPRCRNCQETTKKVPTVTSDQ